MGPSSGATPLHNLTVSRRQVPRDRQDSRSAALEGIITAVAAFATAYFTWTIWRVNASQLAHSHRIERAYMSGGGYRAKRPVGMSAYQIPILGETGEFQFCVNNYGKTPGTLHGLGYGFCDENAIPPIPAYTIFIYTAKLTQGGVASQLLVLRTILLSNDFRYSPFFWLSLSHPAEYGF